MTRIMKKRMEEGIDRELQITQFGFRKIRAPPRPYTACADLWKIPTCRTPTSNRRPGLGKGL